jgi:NAD(P)-dependent dehydrogenase (short-subunit alcohol dehydrogenase family)
VTGASTGIGYATVLELLRFEDNFVFGSVRKPDDAARLQAEFGERFMPLIFDVTDTAQIQAAADIVRERVGDAGLYGLINNAGVAVAGPLMHIDLGEVRRQFEINVFGVLAVTQAFLPLLGASMDAPHPPGRIVNVSSVSGSIVYPFLGPYAASKHALEAFSTALRRELLLYGIDVVVVAAGSVNTPIWDKAEELDIEAYKATDYGEFLTEIQKTRVEMGRQGMPAERVAQTIRVALEIEKPKTRYVLTNNWWFGWILPRWVPARTFDRLIGRQLGVR